MIIGVTGGFGAGKSSFARALLAFLQKTNSTSNSILINADDVVHQIFDRQEAESANGIIPGTLFHKLQEKFGEAVITDAGKLDRRVLAERAFGDDAAAQQLNELIHPLAINYTKGMIESNPDSQIILDVPLLYESGMDSLCDKVIAVTADDEIRKPRTAKFGNFEARDKRQMPQTEKAKRADHHVENNGHPEDLSKAAKEIALKLLS